MVHSMLLIVPTGQYLIILIGMRFLWKTTFLTNPCSVFLSINLFLFMLFCTCICYVFLEYTCNRPLLLASTVISESNQLNCCFCCSSLFMFVLVLHCVLFWKHLVLKLLPGITETSLCLISAFLIRISPLLDAIKLLVLFVGALSSNLKLFL
jgi:hypothetical protein